MKAGPFIFDRRELGGSFGDLGTLVPIMVGLITICGLNPFAVLLMVGVAYIAAGLYYRLPVPVQPLKALGAIAIGAGLGREEISAGAISIGVVLLLLSSFNLTGFISRLFSKPIVRGIQLGLGLILMKKALEFISADGVPGIIIGICGLAILLVLRRNRHLPGSIALVLAGVLVGFFTKGLPDSIAPEAPKIAFPSLQNFQLAAVLLVIPQLPLTLGNAVVASSETARQYFKEKAYRVTPRALSLSMGVINVLTGLLGGMPICHGSGGLTAHYKFGARTGGANLMIGSLFLVGAVFFVRPALVFFSLIPLSVLGVLLGYVGLQHSLFLRDLKQREDIAIAVLVAAVSIFTSNLAIGFAAGIALWHIPRMFKARRPAMDTATHGRSTGETHPGPLPRHKP